MLLRTVIGTSRERSAAYPDFVRPIPRLVTGAASIPTAAPLYTQLCRLSATIIALTALCATTADAKVDPDSEYLGQLRREGHSEFCAAVGRPSQRLAQAINQAMQQDPTWANEAAWFGRIAEAYRAAGCGDT